MRRENHQTQGKGVFQEKKRRTMKQLHRQQVGSSLAPILRRQNSKLTLISRAIRVAKNPVKKNIKRALHKNISLLLRLKTILRSFGNKSINFSAWCLDASVTQSLTRPRRKELLSSSSVKSLCHQTGSGQRVREALEAEVQVPIYMLTPACFLRSYRRTSH